ncbi:MAG TPA: SAM-dependent methyltransferase [Streptosporangiaceae bacterium]|nr:SAM-dependent methyltransferase [Streptosporangiaceae bacterium]
MADGRNGEVSVDEGEGTASCGKWADYDTGVAHSARVYNYLLGGKDNFAADRAAGDLVIQALPGAVLSARANRAFLGRAVRFLADQAGIRQFLDIGTGIPAANNTHQVAQAIAPESRVVYVDNDPIVLAHARALLASHPAGATDYIEADLRDPRKILDSAALLDFTHPVAVMLLAILHFFSDEDDPHQIVATIMDALPTGSYLVISHAAEDINSEAMARMASTMKHKLPEQGTVRDHAAVVRFFDGLELIEPGVVQLSKWRPESPADAELTAVAWAGVGCKRRGQ